MSASSLNLWRIIHISDYLVYYVCFRLEHTYGATLSSRLTLLLNIYTNKKIVFAKAF